MIDFLYNIFILPVEMMVEFIFYFMNDIFVGHPGVSILFVSLAINLLILPLYKRADDMQEQEREKTKSMEHWNSHIRKTFKGDERYMMQSTYYRIEGYKPLYAIKGSLSLIFQVPFFIAGYHFLSNLDALNGMSFLMIEDLGSPDKIIKIGDYSINLLPILMTTINIVSGIIYSKGLKIKDKIQIFGIAIIFLVLLYKSPAGLVLYWTSNNMFSLCKNIVMKIFKNRFAGCNSKQKNSVGKWAALKDKWSVKPNEVKHIKQLFWISALLNTVMLGLMIPAELIESAPGDFGGLTKNGPLVLLLNTFPFYIGLFIVWIGVFFVISRDSVKRIIAYTLFTTGVCSLINYFYFYGSFGAMSYFLVFDETPVINDTNKLINAAVLIPIILLSILVAKKLPKIAKAISAIITVVAAITSMASMYETQDWLVTVGYYETREESEITETVPLSREGNNVIVIMLDRAISEYVPYIFQEKPEISEAFEDFVYYPNTISYGRITNMASPALFGGYEYTPTEIEARSDKILMEKHNEALLLLPTVFSENDYEVDVVDLPYANYQDYPDIELFEQYEHITGHITKDKFGYYMFTDEELSIQKKHMIYYSLFRTVPEFAQGFVYDNGDYLGRSMTEITIPYCAEAYATLSGLGEYTYIEEGNTNRLFMLNNMIAHEPTWLSTPDYVIGDGGERYPYSEEMQESYVINGKQLYMNSYDSICHYHVNVAAYKLLGEFFEYLKDEGVYDNTRIIIVSDHGWSVNQMDGVTLRDGGLLDGITIESYNPVLMVKDFADSDAMSQGETWYMPEANLTVCDTFMTNADVATLCVSGLIDNPINPFTGKPINNDEKFSHPQLITTSFNYLVAPSNDTVFDYGDYDWLSFDGDNVRDLSNWSILDAE